MTVRLNDKIITIPSRQEEFTLGQRIAFQKAHGPALKEMYDKVQEMEDSEDKELFKTHFYYETMFRTVAFFLGVKPDLLKQMEFIDEVGRIYHGTLEGLFEQPETDTLSRSFTWNDQQWVLPNPELKNGDGMTFGELIDAKQTVRDIAAMGGSKWEYVLPIACIYLRKPGEEYNESLLFENSPRLKLMEKLPMTIAHHVSFFFEEHNTFLNDHFEVFGKSRVKSTGKFMRDHFERYGWINFLKSLAATKVFDKAGSGMNSIDCVRKSPAFDVLIYASEDKAFNESLALDQEIEFKKQQAKSKLR